MAGNDIQNLVAALTVAAAGAYLGARMWRSARSRRGGCCGTGCGPAPNGDDRMNAGRAVPFLPAENLSDQARALNRQRRVTKIAPPSP